MFKHGGHLHLHCVTRPLALGEGERRPVSHPLCVVHCPTPPTIGGTEKLVSSQWVMRGTDLAPFIETMKRRVQIRSDEILTQWLPHGRDSVKIAECKDQGKGMLTWLSTRSSVSVAFSRTAFSTAMSPVLLMKLDSMFRLRRLRFSRNMSATAWVVGTWVRIRG